MICLTYAFMTETVCYLFTSCHDSVACHCLQLFMAISDCPWLCKHLFPRHWPLFMCGFRWLMVWNSPFQRLGNVLKRENVTETTKSSLCTDCELRLNQIPSYYIREMKESEERCSIQTAWHGAVSGARQDAEELSTFWASQLVASPQMLKRKVLVAARNFARSIVLVSHRRFAFASEKRPHEKSRSSTWVAIALQKQFYVIYIKT